MAVPSAYNNTGGVTPDWLNKGDNAWQLTAGTLVGLQSVPGLVILYGSIVKKKMRRQLGLHGVLCFRSCATVLGHLGVQDVVRGEAAAVLGQRGDDTHM